jgi:hypothetical protein
MDRTRTYGAMALALGLCVLAGCGGNTVVKTVTQSQASRSQAGVTGAPTGTVPPAPYGLKECRLLRTEKKCLFTHEVTIHVQRHEALRLKTLTAKLVGVRTAALGKGEDLIVTLNVKNDTTSPKQFGRAGAAPTMVVAGNQFREEALNSEREDPNSFISQNEPIQPHASKTADVIFVVPRSVAKEVMQQLDGAVFIGNFGSSFTKNFPQTGLGLISVATKAPPGAAPGA